MDPPVTTGEGGFVSSASVGEDVVILLYVEDDEGHTDEVEDTAWRRERSQCRDEVLLLGT